MSSHVYKCASEQRITRSSCIYIYICVCVCVQDLGFGIVDGINLYTVGGTLIGASWFVETVTITYDVTAYLTANGEPVIVFDEDDELASSSAATRRIQVTERFDVGEWIENFSWSGQKTHVFEKKQELNQLESVGSDREQQQQQQEQQKTHQSRTSNTSNERSKKAKPNQCGASDTVVSAKTHHDGWWRKRKEIDVIVAGGEGTNDNEDIFASKAFAEELRDAYRALNLSDALDTAAEENDIDLHWHRYLLRLVDRLTHTHEET